MSLPRAQHYQYAHRGLPELFFMDPARFMDALSDRGIDFLQSVWEYVANRLQHESNLSTEGLSGELRWLDDGTAVAIIAMPAPESVTEAHFVAPVHRAQGPKGPEVRRFFTLEYSLDVQSGAPITMLCEWTADGKHINFGGGPEPTAAAFLKAVRDVLAE